MAKYPVDYIARLAKAVTAASRSLAKEDPEEAAAWRAVLNPERAWPLSVLLAFWYLLQAGRESGYRTAIRALAEDSRASTPAADFDGIWRYFDMYKNLLSRPAQLAYEGKTSNELALAGGAFKYAAQQIGAAPLARALQSSLFAAVSERLRQLIPVPGGGLSASEVSSKQSAQPIGATAAPSARASLTAAPVLSAQDRCVLLLVSRGHSQKDAEQICQGPPRVASRLSAAAKGKKA